MTGPLYSLRGVSYAYPSGEAPAVDGLDLEVGHGEAVALLGPNGAGKSTLLRLLAGVLTPTAGTVLLEGRPLRDLNRRDVARRVAVLPQRLQVAFEVEVEQVVALGRTPHGAPLGGWWGTDVQRRDRQAVETALRATDTARFRERTLHQLSGGEQQRVALALALAQEADVLLLDEPTSHLDPHQAQAVLDLVAAVQRERRLTVISVFHDLNLAALYSERMLLLHHGRLLASGTAAEVIRPDVLGRAFGDCLRYVVHPDSGRPQVLPAGGPHDHG